MIAIKVLLWVLIAAGVLAFGVALVVLPNRAEASVPCSRGVKVVPPQQCAFWNMAEAAPVFYASPSFKAFYVQQTPIGRYHSVWTGYISYPGKAIRYTLTARRCGNTYVTYNHRKNRWWPRAC